MKTALIFDCGSGNRQLLERESSRFRYFIDHQIWFDFELNDLGGMIPSLAGKVSSPMCFSFSENIEY